MNAELHSLVISAAAAHADRWAVTGPSGTMRYADLDRRADELACVLAEHGVRPRDRVLIWADKSPTVVAAMQAVLRLGAAYVPAAGTTPHARVALMAADCAARVTCTTADRVNSDLPTAVVDLNSRPDGTAQPVNQAVDPSDLAYILYTSGSTGVPKGVCISHRNALSFVEWAVAELAAGPEDRFANHAPFTFDLSVLDLYASFAVGASVSLVPATLAYTPAALVEFLYDERITVWYSVPSALSLMIRDGGLVDRRAPDGLRAILFAGEPFPIGYVRQLAVWTGARLLNLYGPTETNVCTWHEVRAGDLERDRPVPVGRPACGDKVWAVKRGNGVAGPGEEGELLVDGPTVMLGYWGAPPQRGAYRTGDLVRVLDDGALDYVGRVDHMVKVRGNRVEPGEVEAVLGAHPGVAEVAVVVLGSGIEARLVAYVVRHPGHRVGALALKRHSAARLPPYMIADRFVFAPDLPRTRNGKIDRFALTRHEQRSSAP